MIDYRSAMDALAFDRVKARCRPDPLRASIRAGLYGWNAILVVPGGWSIIRPLAMDPVLWHAVRSRRALRGEPAD